MSATRAERLSNWLGLLAAMVYLATFLAVVYGCYALARGGSFLDGIATAYPLTFAFTALLFASCAMLEMFRANLKRPRSEHKPAPAHPLTSH